MILNKTTSRLSLAHPISHGTTDFSLWRPEVGLHQHANITGFDEYVFGQNVRVVLVEMRDFSGQFHGSLKRVNLLRWSSHVANVRAVNAYVSEHHFVGFRSNTNFDAIELRPVDSTSVKSTFSLSQLFAFGCNARDFREYVKDLLAFRDWDSPHDAMTSTFSRSWVLGSSDHSRSPVSMSISDFCANAGLLSNLPRHPKSHQVNPRMC